MLSFVSHNVGTFHRQTGKPNRGYANGTVWNCRFLIKRQGTMTGDKLKKIQEHIERMVTQLAREHQTTDEVIWKQMLIDAAYHTGVDNVQIV